MMRFSQRAQLFELFRIPARLRKAVVHPNFSGRQDLELLVGVMRGGRRRIRQIDIACAPISECVHHRTLVVWHATQRVNID